MRRPITAQFVRADRQRQGLPATVTDVAVLARIEQLSTAARKRNAA